MARGRNASGKNASGKAPSQRQLRVGELVRHALTTVLQRGEARAPELQTAVLSVSEVTMSPDLKHATAFVSALGLDDAREAVLIEALNAEASHLRHAVAPHLNHMKTLPQLRFRADTSYENYAKIDALLARPEVRRDVEGDAPARSDGNARGDIGRDGD